jgi:hypothetical protein
VLLTTLLPGVSKPFSWPARQQQNNNHHHHCCFDARNRDSCGLLLCCQLLAGVQRMLWGWY